MKLDLSLERLQNAQTAARVLRKASAEKPEESDPRVEALQNELDEMKSVTREAMQLMTEALGKYLSASDPEDKKKARGEILAAAQAFEKVEALIEKKS